MYVISEINRSVKILIGLFVVAAMLAIFSDDARPAAKGFAPKPCLDCHKEKSKELGQKFVHAPMAGKECESCHLRHGKFAVLSLTEREEIKLCFICHTKMASEVENCRISIRH
jgi:predicted CXXCH cytochrome family protein